MSAPVRCGCGAYFVWAETPKGDRIPVDPAPRADGEHELIRRPDQDPLFRYVKPAKRFGRTNLYAPHFATCPDADKYRRRGPDLPATGFWLLAKTPADQPYPCLCHRDGHGCRAGGRHCPCWGRPDLDHLPQACCAAMAARQSMKEH